MKSSVPKSTPLSKLKPDPKNANRGTARGAELLDESLEDGAGRSLLIDKNNVTIAGNKTLAAAKRAGFKSVLIVETDGTQLVAVKRTDLDLSKDPRAKKLALADNRIAELGLDWDPDVIASIGEEIDLGSLFSGKELTAIIAEQDAEAATLLTDEDDAPEPPKKPTSKRGDVWALGAHRLMCGDSTAADDVARLMDGELADCVWTDPPYGVSYVGKTKDALTIKNDALADDGNLREFLMAAFQLALGASTAGAPWYVASPAGPILGTFAGCLKELNIWHQTLNWIKNSMVLGRGDYHFKHETLFYGWSPGAAHKWYGGRTKTSCIEIDRPSRSTEHPTMKPVALIEECLVNSTARDARVLDLFGGSGSTLIACEKLGRKCFTMELDPQYADVIRIRWEQATGRKAVLTDGGKKERTQKTPRNRAGSRKARKTPSDAGAA